MPHTMRQTTKPTHHPLYRHPLVKGMCVTPMEYHMLVSAMMYTDATFMEMNALVGIRRAQAVRTVYFPN